MAAPVRYTPNVGDPAPVRHVALFPNVISSIGIVSRFALDFNFLSTYDVKHAAPTEEQCNMLAALPCVEE